MGPLDKPLYKFRCSVDVETGTGTRYAISYNVPVTAASVEQAIEAFKIRLNRVDGPLSLRLEDFDLTGAASALTDAIDVTWTDDVYAQRIF